MQALLLLFYVILASCVAAEGDVVYLKVGGRASLVVAVDTTKGNYSIVVDGQPWFSSGQYALYSAANWYRSSDATLKLVGFVSTPDGNDTTLGPYQELSLSWLAGTISFQTSFISFTNYEIVLFEQYFAKGVQSSSVPGTATTVVASFPTLNASTPLYYYTHSDTFAYPTVGNWPNPGFPDGYLGGPITFYNSNFRTLVLSPFDNFMVGVQTLSPDVGGDLAFGLNGMVLQIPEKYNYTTILYGGQGIGNTLYNWGATLLKQYNKTRTPLNGDKLISSLGYWTDNGAYYYYNTEPGKDYAQTMVDVKLYLANNSIPAKYYQFDSWWYYKGKNNGVSLWEATPAVFPNGMVGVTSKLGTNVALHNRYFATDSPYIGNYSFIVEDYCALPADQALFDHIMGKAKGWGMNLYEQDWLVTTYMKMVATRNNVSNSRNWLINMGNAASALGITIQYCMALPRHLLQSVEIAAVTQSRASDDYQPSNLNWQIFHTSQLIWALGMVPFKDVFWTTGTQPNCPYSVCVEANPLLEVLVAALSAGPIAPADAIHYANKDFILRTCNARGDLLKADLPATPLDSTFLPRAGATTPSVLQVAASYTQIGSYRWYYLLGAGLQAPFNVTVADLPPVGGFPMKVFNYFQFSNVTNFDGTNQIHIPASTIKGVVGFSYFIVAPVLESGWVLLGETSKFITVSKQRLALSTSTSSMLGVSVYGASGESVSLWLINTQAAAPLNQRPQSFPVVVPPGDGNAAQLLCNAGPTGTCKSST